MDLTFLSEADNVTLKLELAKRALEVAKAELEQAKQAYDEMVAQADAHGIPKAKLKKLTDDRVQALFESGILGTAKGRGEILSAGAGESKRVRKAAKKSEGEVSPKGDEERPTDEVSDHEPRSAVESGAGEGDFADL